MIKSFFKDDPKRGELEEIFWMTSPIVEREKKDDSFLYKYFNRYLDNALPVFYAEEKKKVLGYILGETQTLDPFYFNTFPYYLDFKFLNDFPAHLHINCHESARGQGVGSKLLSYFEDHLKNLRVLGLHLVTLDGARNINFYKKAGYTEIQRISYHGVNLLYLGKKL